MSKKPFDDNDDEKRQINEDVEAEQEKPAHLREKGFGESEMMSVEFCSKHNQYYPRGGSCPNC